LVPRAPLRLFLARRGRDRPLPPAPPPPLPGAPPGRGARPRDRPRLRLAPPRHLLLPEALAARARRLGPGRDHVRVLGLHAPPPLPPERRLGRGPHSLAPLRDRRGAPGRLAREEAVGARRRLAPDGVRAPPGLPPVRLVLGAHGGALHGPPRL